MGLPSAVTMFTGAGIAIMTGESVPTGERFVCWQCDGDGSPPPSHQTVPQESSSLLGLFRPLSNRGISQLTTHLERVLRVGWLEYTTVVKYIGCPSSNKPYAPCNI